MAILARRPARLRVHLGGRFSRALYRRCSWPSWSIRSSTGCGWAATRRLYAELFSDPIYQKTVVNTLLFLVFGVNLKLFFALMLSGFFMRKGWWVKALLMIFVLPWAVPALPTFISIHWMLNGEWGLLNNGFISCSASRARRGSMTRWLALGSAIYCASVEMAAVLDRDPARRPDVDPAGDL